MTEYCRHTTPLGEVLLAGEDGLLTGLWFVGQKYFPGLPERENPENPPFPEVRHWLDRYFAGKKPEVSLPLGLKGSDFQLAVWQLLLEIPYGQTVTYGHLAAQIAKARGCAAMSAQAVGAAVGRNPISILVPCHRVVGSRGQLTGYAGGLERKIALLRLEQGE